MGLSLWDKLERVWTKEPLGEPVGSDIWVLNRFLSMDDDLLPIVRFLNQFFFSSTPDEYFKLLQAWMPKGKKWLKYAKVKKLTEDEVPDEILERVAQRYWVDKRTARDIVIILGHENVVAEFGYNTKESLRPTRAKGSKKKGKEKSTGKSLF